MRRGVAWWPVAVALVVGCAQALDLPERELDETYQPGSSAGGQAQEPPLTCELFCKTAKDVCTGEWRVYPSESSCIEVCKLLPMGDPGDSGKNTIQCRYDQLRLAQKSGSLEFHCPPAGPGGSTDGESDVCGTNCQGFCSLAVQICPAVYATDEACMTACGDLKDIGGFSAKNHQEGDTLQCRLYHIAAAAEYPSTHCQHVAGKALCVD